MEITGKIIQACEPRSGVSKTTGNPWKTQEFVIETQEQYPKKCVFNVFGEDKLNEFNIQPGQTLHVLFDIDAREYNGRWYNDVRAWKVEHLDGGMQPENSPYAVQTPIVGGNQPYPQKQDEPPF